PLVLVGCVSYRVNASVRLYILVFQSDLVILHLFFLLLRPAPRSTLFPYTTLFRSRRYHWTARDESFVCGGFSLGNGNHLCVVPRSEEHTSELQSRFDLVCRLLLEKKKYDQTLKASATQLRQIAKMV